MHVQGRTPDHMEKITFTAPETGETLSFYVLEQTVVSGREYILAAESEAEEAEAYILRKTSDVSTEEAGYEFVEDDEELSSIGKVFAELLDDTDIVW